MEIDRIQLEKKPIKVRVSGKQPFISFPNKCYVCNCESSTIVKKEVTATAYPPGYKPIEFKKTFNLPMCSYHKERQGKIFASMLIIILIWGIINFFILLKTWMIELVIINTIIFIIPNIIVIFSIKRKDKYVVNAKFRLPIQLYTKIDNTVSIDYFMFSFFNKAFATEFKRINNIE